MHLILGKSVFSYFDMFANYNIEYDSTLEFSNSGISFSNFFTFDLKICRFIKIKSVTLK